MEDIHARMNLLSILAKIGGDVNFGFGFQGHFQGHKGQMGSLKFKNQVKKSLWLPYYPGHCKIWFIHNAGS